MTGDVVVRRCIAAEVDLIASREPVGKNYARATFARQESGACCYLVAWLGDEPVGSGEVEWAAVPELKNLRVEPSRRGEGVGTAITAAAEREAAPLGRLAIGVGTDNPDARRLYERLGYRATGRTETYSYQYVDDDGVRHSAVETAEYLGKQLTASATASGSLLASLRGDALRSTDLA